MVIRRTGAPAPSEMVLESVLSTAVVNKIRRTQAERAAETREALLKATIKLLHGKGYGGTPTELVAEEAGVSRGALRHHFPTRAQLMAEVISTVYSEEHEAYQEMSHGNDRGSRLADWPEMLWEVLSRPSGLAVLEILQASRSDPELAALVAPMQAEIEMRSLAFIRERYGSVDDLETLAAIRLFVWSVRGLSIAQVLTSDPADVRRSIAFLRRMIEGAVTSGAVPDRG